MKEILPGAIQADAKNAENLQIILDNADQLVKKSIWCFGGDGWAYDIGYGEMCIRDRAEAAINPAAGLHDALHGQLSQNLQVEPFRNGHPFRDPSGAHLRPGALGHQDVYKRQHQQDQQGAVDHVGDNRSHGGSQNSHDGKAQLAEDHQIIEHAVDDDPDDGGKGGDLQLFHTAKHGPHSQNDGLKQVGIEMCIRDRT